MCEQCQFLNKKPAAVREKCCAFLYFHNKVKVKVTLEQAMKAQGRHEIGVCGQRHIPPLNPWEIAAVLIIQKAGWAPGSA